MIVVILLLVFVAVLLGAALEPLVGQIRGRTGIGRGLSILIVYATFLVAVVGVYAASERAYELTAPLFWLERPFWQGVGAALLAASLVWTAVAQAQMGASWRIGIDRAAATELVARGLFARSRNPIFLGMRVSLLGFFLLLPNAVTLLTLVLGEVLVQLQVRLEEAFLTKTQGDAYRAYRRRVRRWL